MRTIQYNFKKTAIAVLFIFVFVSINAEEFFVPGISAQPVDSKADKCVLQVMKFFADTYGQKTISGQMDLTWKDSVDMAERVFNDTGKYPALMGFDFMNYTVGYGDGNKQVEEAIAWWEKGGLVAFCWHWRDPNRTGGFGEFYTDKTKFRIPYDIETKRLKEDTREFKSINKCLDKIAVQLKRLEEANVPVLWRPLHEASGAWFWWGASGSNAYIALYQYMYDYLTNKKDIHNLIWVWNGQDKDWYPGDKYVDIIGYDIYANNHESQLETFNECWEMSDDSENSPKMIALSENGRIPEPKKMEKDFTYWLWFMTWNDGNNEGTQNDNFWSGEYFNNDDFKKEVYNSEYILTLDELPDFKNYPLK